MGYSRSNSDHSTPAEGFKVSDLVYITSAGHEWVCRTKGPASGAMFLVGRVAVIQDIYDWGSARGKSVLEKRRSTGKWESLDPTLFKYVLMVMFPEIESDGKAGLGIPEVLPLYHPLSNGTQPLFKGYPAHLAELLTGSRRFK